MREITRRSRTTCLARANAASVAALLPTSWVKQMLPGDSPHRWRARRERACGVGHGGQDFIVGHDQVGRVLCGGKGLADDRDHGIADQRHPVERERAKRRLVVGPPVRALAFSARGQGADAVRFQVLAGEDRNHARCCCRRGDIDRADVGGTVRRAQHIEPRLARKRDVVGIAPAPAQELEILDPRNGAADVEFTHPLSPHEAGRIDARTPAGAARVLWRPCRVGIALLCASQVPRPAALPPAQRCERYLMTTRAKPRAPSLRLAVDIGGTFTDIAVFDDATGKLSFGKVLSTPQRLVDGINAGVAKAGDRLRADAPPFSCMARPSRSTPCWSAPAPRPRS